MNCTKMTESNCYCEDCCQELYKNKQPTDIERLDCKFCGRQPKHNMFKGVYHQYICHCLHCTSTNETTTEGAINQWNIQNGSYER